MIDDMDSPSTIEKCGRKTSLSIFFTICLISSLLCTLGLISPSWQWLSLENGRSEHHHGLWLDCKRDFSHDYGRTREYYETLYRRDMQGSPFDLFYLPRLECIYKFDYYIDPDDLYDHNHDENRIQNDAYQHLFLGWKIAALVGVGVGVIFGFTTIALGVCSFCHKTFICAGTVLITIAAILSTLGSAIFYIWSNYQDNRIIKDDDTGDVNEQILGWAYWCHLVGTTMFWLASLMGCCTTSIAFSKTRAKLVKVEVVERDETERLTSTSNIPLKRSYSAVYKVDSSALRQWERSYLQSTCRFNRTSSVPNMSRKNRKSLSNSQTNPESTSVESLNTPLTTLKSVLKTPKTTRKVPPAPLPDPKQCYSRPSRQPLYHDYEYCGSSTTTGGRESPQNIYDEVAHPSTYLEPMSVRNIKSSCSTISDFSKIKDFGLPLTNNVGSCSVEKKAYENPSYLWSRDTPPPEIAINTFSSRQKSLTSLSVRDINIDNNARVLFDRTSPSSTINTRPLRMLSTVPDEIDRSIGTSTIVENDTRSYIEDAVIRLNLFKNDTKQDETTV